MSVNYSVYFLLRKNSLPSGGYYGYRGRGKGEGILWRKKERSGGSDVV